MRKKVSFILALLVICPIIAASAFASSSNEQMQPLQPQDIQNRSQLSLYVEAVENINRELTSGADTANYEDVVPATITFSEYISFDDLQDYIDLYDIRLQQIQLRGLTEDGTRVTIATLVHMGMDYTEGHVYKQAEEQKFEIVGITDVYAYVLPSKVESMAQDDLTYLVDTSGAEAIETQQVSSANEFGEAVNEVEGEEESAFPKSLTWELEDLNIL